MKPVSLAAASISMMTLPSLARLYTENTYNDDHGIVQIHERQADGSWPLVTTLGATPPGDNSYNTAFGFQVAVHQHTAAITAPYEDNLSGGYGVLYILGRQTDGQWTTAQKLSVSKSEWPEFGLSLDFDGARIAVGAPYAELDNGSYGAVYVFENSNGTWNQTATLSSGAHGGLGSSIKIFEDQILIGCAETDSAVLFEQDEADNWSITQTLSLRGFYPRIPSLDMNSNTILLGSDSGEALVFRRSDEGVWEYSLALSDSADGSNSNEFGTSVVLDEYVAFVGDPRADLKYTTSGKFYSFYIGRDDSYDCNGNGVCDDQEIVASNYVLDCNENGILDSCDIGSGTSLDSDGDGVPDECGIPCPDLITTLPWEGLNSEGTSLGLDVAIDGPHAAVLLTDQGDDQVQFFKREGQSWIPDGLLDAPDVGAWVQPNKAIDVSGDTAIIGYSLNSDPYGRVAIYRRLTHGWVQQATFQGTEPNYFGISVAVQDDIAIVGSPEQSPEYAKAYIYKRYGESWIPVQVLQQETPWFGNQVAIDGSTLMVGCLGLGVWVYEQQEDNTWEPVQYIEDVQPAGNLGGSVDLSGDLAIAGGYYTDTNNIAQIFRRKSGQWVAETALDPGPGIAGLGAYVRIQGNIAVATSGRWNAYESKKRVHVFEHDGQDWQLRNVFEDQTPLPSQEYPARIDLADNQLIMGFISVNDSYRFDEVNVVTLSQEDEEGEIADCNNNGICDSIDLANGISDDCDGNGTLDTCDIADGLYNDVDQDGIPDACEDDCDSDLIPDDYEIEQGTEQDCNGNGIPDLCDIKSGNSPDGDGDGIPDECNSKFVVNVSSDGTGLFDQIQPAIDFAGPGATILVQPGLYDGSIVFPDHPISVISSSGPEETILISADADAIVVFADGLDENSVLEGFTLTGASGLFGGAVIISESSPSIRNCIFLANHAIEGGGLFVLNGAPDLEDCHFLGNMALRGGGASIWGIHADGDAVQFEGCIFENNNANGSGFNEGSGGGLAINDGLIDISNCLFLANTSSFTAGGFIGTNSQTTIDSCEFRINVCSFSNGSAVAAIGGSLSIAESYFCLNNGNTVVLGQWDDLGGNMFGVDCDENGNCDDEEITADPSLDCNENQILDVCEIADGQLQDCNGNLIPDYCELWTDCNGNGEFDACDIESGVEQDCNANGIPDWCDINVYGTSFDFNQNGVPDECKPDCNENGIPDYIDIGTGNSEDCDANGVPDECEDCNDNGIGDTCDILDGTSNDVNGNGIPDECDGDCDSDGLPDDYEIDEGLELDCNNNALPDWCDINVTGDSLDCNDNSVPDECDIESGESSDCNGNGIPDSCDLESTISQDCNLNGIPDECDIESGTANDCDFDGIPDSCDEGYVDCNNNGLMDSCDIDLGGSQDCNSNGIPDECDAAQGILNDCDGNGLYDECEEGYADCQPNGIADFCDIADGASDDLNTNGIPDECDPDCNDNGYPDFIDIAFGTSQDLNNNGIPDECECPDTNADGIVDVNDILTVIGAWGDCVPDSDCPADVDGDGTVNVNDVLLVIGEWGTCE